eukprot:4428696-Ditylum_brightwellii.AAC.1
MIPSAFSGPMDYLELTYIAGVTSNSALLKVMGGHKLLQTTGRSLQLDQNQQPLPVPSFNCKI